MSAIYAESKPERIFYLFQLGVEEILGTTETDTLIQKAWMEKEAKKAEYLLPGEFQNALEMKFGVQGGRGLAQRAGRSGFKFFLRKYGRELNLLGLDYRLQPTHARITQGLVTLAAFFGEDGSPPAINEQESTWSWGISGCEFCIGREDPGVICSFLTGMMQEFMTWAGGGKVYLIKEIECQAQGKQRCLFRIDKKPID